MPTAGAIVNRVITAAGRSDLSSEILNLLNELIARFTIEFNFPLQEQIKTRNTVAGQDRYVAPADQIDWRTMYIIDVDGVTEDEILVRSRGELEVLFSLDTAAASRAKPIYVAYEKQEYMFRPVPDLSTYTFRLHYYAAPTALGSGDSNEFTNKWSKVLELGTLSQLYYQIGNEKLYDFWNKQFLFEFEKMKMAMRKQQLKSATTLPIRKGPIISRTFGSNVNPGYPWWGKF